MQQAGYIEEVINHEGYSERNILKAQTEVLLEQFLKDKEK